jgi:hypothetical protein
MALRAAELLKRRVGVRGGRSGSNPSTNRARVTAAMGRVLQYGGLRLRSEPCHLFTSRQSPRPSVRTRFRRVAFLLQRLWTLVTRRSARSKVRTCPGSSIGVLEWHCSLSGGGLPRAVRGLRALCALLLNAAGAAAGEWRMRLHRKRAGACPSAATAEPA